ncbi:protein PYRICULARIA ORYZAE RESISTANCE 21-like [Nymphaea colorata]|nr:protein PYRICULARIA ORYZAE RESISTANCE 21-like [Nymphaea colorata]
MAKVYSIVITAKMDCRRCDEKIKKAVCSICVCEINSITFDEKCNKVTLVGVFDPKKVVKKICQKAGKCIEGIEVSEVVSAPPTKEETCGDKEKKEAEGKDKGSEKKKDPSEAKEKPKAECEKDGAKEKDKGSKKKKDPSVVVVVVTPPAPAPAPAPRPPTAPPKPPRPEPRDPPQKQVIACAPVALLGAPVGCCRCGPSQCGGFCKPCQPEQSTRPCTCRCRNRCDPCCVSSQGCRPCHCVTFTEEDSTCKTM